MTILIQILIAIVLVALVVWLTSVYWQGIIHKQNMSGHNKTEPQSLERMKERAASREHRGLVLVSRGTASANMLA